jgi:hypothetical protein
MPELEGSGMPTMDDRVASRRHRANHDPVRRGVRRSRADPRRELACSRRASGSHKGAELLHPGLDLTERQARLMARLEVGLPASAAELAVHLGGRITRADYLRLVRSALCDVDTLEAAPDEELLGPLGNDVEKLAAVRAAVRAYRATRSEGTLSGALLPSPED